MRGEQDEKQDGERVEEKTYHVVISLLGLVDDFASVSTHNRVLMDCTSTYQSPLCPSGSIHRPSLRPPMDCSSRRLSEE